AHYLSLRQNQRAIDQMNLMKDKVDPDIRDFALGRAEDLFHHYDEAEKWYRSHLERNPHDADTLEHLAKLYLRQNRPLDAEKVLLKMLEPRVSVLEEDLPGIRRMLALVLTAPEQPMDRVDTALAVLALNRGPAGESALDKRLSLLVRGRRAADRADILKALEELSTDPEPGSEEQLRLALLYQQQGDWPRARSLLLTLLNRDEENPGVLAALVDGLLRNGKYAEAALQLPRLEKLEPSSPRVEDFRKRLRDSTKIPNKKPPAPTKKSA
ncbi:MAG: tetratricopeptide repeat protein, partial [Gemmataceae bacterium]